MREKVRNMKEKEEMREKGRKMREIEENEREREV